MARLHPPDTICPNSCPNSLLGQNRPRGQPVPGSIRKRTDRGGNVYELRVFLGRDVDGRVRHKSTIFRGPLRAAEMELARLVTQQAAEPDPIPVETAFGPTTTVNMAIEAWKEN